MRENTLQFHMHELEAMVLKAAYRYAEALRRLNETPASQEAKRDYHSARSDLAVAAADLIDVPEADRAV